jgi:MoxR-like ATPase
VRAEAETTTMVTTTAVKEDKDLALAPYRRSLDELRRDIKSQVSKAIVGNEEIVDLVFVAAVANGHVLMEGPPGVAKTLLSGSIARAMGLDFNRIQFTPDTAPTHIVGKTVKRMGESIFEHGPLFTNMLLADEINRTPPRTQAAMLEAMEERHVTVDGRTRWLPNPFIVVATQNPYESEGVYDLPDSQLDRFLFKVRLDYGDDGQELEVLMRPHRGVAPDMLEDVEPVMDAAALQTVQRRLDAVEVPDDVGRYVVSIVRSTRRHPGARLGASPRGAVHLFAAAKARALLHNRAIASFEDVELVAEAVLAHRVLLREGYSGAQVVRDALAEAAH